MRKTVSGRDFRKFDAAQFASDLINLNLATKLAGLSSVNDMIILFNTSLNRLLDKHAPYSTRSITERDSSSWYTNELREEKIIKRRLERLAQRSGLASDHAKYRTQCIRYGKLLCQTRSKYSLNQVEACQKDRTKLFKMCNGMLGKPTKRILPKFDTDEDASAAFSKFFAEKVVNICKDLDQQIAGLESTPLNEHSKLAQILTHTNSVPKLSHFDLTTSDEVEQLIRKSNSKTSPTDVAPTWVIKQFSEHLSEPIAIIINCSISSSTVPHFFKSATVFPCIKEFDMDPNDLNSYRPVSNLPYLSKLLEKVVYSRIEKHLSLYNLLPVNQSAYRKSHSTESSLLKINNDILSAFDRGKCTLMVTLDISAAFDTVNHAALLKRYEQYFGFSDSVLHWMKSYLTGRQQAVQIGQSRSEALAVDSGFPQGSNLGGLKFNMFSTPLEDIISIH